MADLFADDAPDEFMGPDPVGLPEPAPAAEVEEETPAETPEEAAPDPDMFPREYVEELRREAAEYRTRARAYEQKFDGYTEDEREALLDYIHLTRRAEAGDEEAVAQLQELFGPDEDDAPIQAGESPEEAYRRIAREEAQRIADERDARVAAERYEEQKAQNIQTVQQRAKSEFGIEVGSEEYIVMLRGANEAPEGTEDPIAYGYEQVKAYHQRIIQQHLATIQQQNESHQEMPVTTGAAPSSAVQPRTFAQAREAMHERLTRAYGE